MLSKWSALVVSISYCDRCNHANIVPMKYFHAKVNNVRKGGLLFLTLSFILLLLTLNVFDKESALDCSSVKQLVNITKFSKVLGGNEIIIFTHLTVQINSLNH